MEQQSNMLSEFQESTYEYATAGQRFLNYFIDTIAYYILFFLFMVLYGILNANSITEEGTETAGFILVTYVIIFAIVFGYYTLFEGSKGKTLGKLITKTKVVTLDGGHITYGQAFMRTLCRFVPFEPFSAFMGFNMWHDKWTNTMVVKDK